MAQRRGGEILPAIYNYSHLRMLRMRFHITIIIVRSGTTFALIGFKR